MLIAENTCGLEVAVTLVNLPGSLGGQGKPIADAQPTTQEMVKFRKIEGLLARGGKFLENFWTNRRGISYYRIRVRYRGRIRTFRSARPFWHATLNPMKQP